MSGFNKFAGEGLAQNLHAIQYYSPIAKEKWAPSNKVTPSDEVKGTKNLYDKYNTKITEKIELSVCNDSVTPKIRKYKQGMICMMKK